MALVQVQPGNITGIFYIIVANLPWNCSWQKLKDFARNQQVNGTCIEIDHAHVYPDGTTSGWVRVKGKKSFIEAMAHLNTGVLEHRSLVVDGRNETEVTPIKEDGFPGYGAPGRNRNGGSSSCGTWCSLHSPTTGFYTHMNNSSMSTYSGSEGWYALPLPASATAPMSPTSPNVAYYQPSSQVCDNYTSLPTYPSGDYFQAPSPSGVAFAGNMVTTTPVYATPIPQTPVYTYTTATPTPYLEAPFSTQAVPATIKTEARKIVITQLPHSASYYDLEKLLFKYITRAMSKSSPNGPHKELEELSIETRLNKKPRGHAFAILGSEQLARSVAKNLDGVQFHGRILKARLAKEGVKTRPDPAAEPHLMSPPLAYQSQDPLAAQPSPSHIEQVSAVENSSARTMSTTAPRIGSKSTWKTKEGSSERKKKSSSPAVVNGSSSGSTREHDEKSRKYRGFEW